MLPQAIAIIKGDRFSFAKMSNPELAAISFAQKPEADRGAVVKLPRIGNVHLNDPIVPGGRLFYYEALHGGKRIPDSPEIVEGIIRIARKAGEMRQKIGKPFIVTSWYRPQRINAEVGGAWDSRHMYGDAIDFYIEGYSAEDMYKIFDPVWDGGLGRYQRLGVIHIDAWQFARW